MSIQGQPTPMTRLCTSCYTISSQNLDTLLAKPGDGRRGYSWTTTRKRLHASSTLGCPLCTIIFKHTLKSHYYNVPDCWANAELIGRWKAGDEEMPFTFLYSQHWEVEAGSRVFDKIVIEPDKDRGGKGSGIWLDVAAERDKPASSFVKTRPENLDVNSKAVFDLAKSWISACLGSHDKCSNTSVSLPTRVLDLRAVEGDGLVKLCISQGKMAPYVALSYCWGGPQPAVLTTATLETYILGVPLTSNPQTIKDAILVCRKLGFQYLWVDALCIIQDSPEDKAHEIQKMGYIYSNAILTISASSAKSVKDGFLGKRIRRGEDSQWFLLPFYSGDDNSRSTISARQFTTYQTSSEPLNTRAWALQEDILSPRVLAYDSYRIRWQCKTTSYADGGKINDLVLDLNQTQKLVPFGEVKKGEMFPDALKAWIKIVEIYSTRTATFRSDTLPAVSAIAEYFSHVLGDEYFAGLWESYLPQCLMWFARRSDDYDFSQFRNTNQYIAPSWSWASYNGPAWFGHRFGMPDDIEIHVKVEECSVRRALEDMRFGEVIAGHLTISGFLQPAICSARKQKHQSMEFRVVFGVEEIKPVPLSHSTPKPSTEVPPHPSPETFIFYPDDPRDFLQKQMHLHALLLCSFDSLGAGVRLIAGLVVSKIALGEKEGRELWIRRGLFHGTDRNDNFKGSKKVSITIV
ncbi:heterokaryon incompatibility protein-domain-containing protein [Tricladium varicosporioides]|nr:heterokaryon incompatibility protein-domain-containing protein [Hymenoscyphus varicosporioides]